VPSPDDIDAYRWQTAVDFGVVLPGGYFLYPAADGTGHWGAPVRPTETLLLEVQAGTPHTITARDRVRARTDLTHWQADVVVLPVTERRAPQLAATLTDLLGEQPTRVDDVLLWDVSADGAP
jgi:hypothetical protein